MELGIEGRVAVIAGGARGSGLITAERLASEGVKIVLPSRHPEMVKAAEEKSVQPGRSGRCCRRRYRQRRSGHH